MPYAGIYTGTINTYCAEFNYKDEITFYVYENGTVDFPFSRQGDLNDGIINDAGNISGSYLAVQSASAGRVFINYTSTISNENFSASGTSFNGITSIITAKLTSPAYTAVKDTITIFENAKQVVEGELLENDLGVHSETYIYSVKGVQVALGGYSTIKGVYGSLSITASGYYQYTLDNSNTAVDALNDGQSLTDRFSYVGVGTAKSTSQLAVVIKGVSDSDDYTDTLDTKGVVNVDRSATGNIERGGDHDWFKIQLTAGTYQFDLKGEDSNSGTLSDPYLNLRDSSGQIIRSDDDGAGHGSYDSRIVFTTTSGGTFYLDALNHSNVGIGTYTVSLAKLNVPLPPRAEPDSITVVEDSIVSVEGNVGKNDTGGAASIVSVNDVAVAINGSTLIEGRYGNLYIEIDGDYRYEINNHNSSVNFLNEGEYLTDEFSYSVSNVAGSSYSTLTINISGYTDDGLPVGGTIGTPGNDLMFSNVDSNPFDGGLGIDTVSYERSAASVIASILLPSNNVGEAKGDTYLSIENLFGSNFADTLIGDTFNNVLNGRLGADMLIGGKGDDTYIVDNVSDYIVEDAAEGNDTILSSISYQLAARQEIETLRAANTIGTTKLNFIGNEFANALIGNAGANTLNGGAGADRLTGGTGDDSFIVDNTGDLVFEASGGGVDRVFASTSYTLQIGQEIEGLQLLASTGRTNLNLTGNEISQSLVGNNGDNVINGGIGRDAMTGRGGDDTFIIDNIGDRVREAAGGGSDTVLGSTSYALAAGQEIEALQLLSSTGTARLNLSGNEFGQKLVGNNGANVLDGRGGNDLLIGRGGADSFAFSTALGSTNVDRISDFAAEDMMRLSKSIFSALAPGQLAEGAFKNISTGIADSGDRILYKQATGELFYDADGSGNGASVKFAVLDNKAALTAADFLVV